MSAAADRLFRHAARSRRRRARPPAARSRPAVALPLRSGGRRRGRFYARRRRGRRCAPARRRCRYRHPQSVRAGLPRRNGLHPHRRQCRAGRRRPLARPARGGGDLGLCRGGRDRQPPGHAATSVAAAPSIRPLPRRRTGPAICSRRSISVIASTVLSLPMRWSGRPAPRLRLVELGRRWRAETACSAAGQDAFFAAAGGHPHSRRWAMAEPAWVAGVDGCPAGWAVVLPADATASGRAGLRPGPARFRRGALADPRQPGGRSRSTCRSASPTGSV